MAKKKETKNQFQCRLDYIGTNYANVNIETFKDTNAMNLHYQLMVTIARELVGKDAAAELCYCTALEMLKSVTKPEILEKPMDFSDLEEARKSWEIQQEEHTITIPHLDEKKDE